MHEKLIRAVNDVNKVLPGSDQEQSIIENFVRVVGGMSEEQYSSLSPQTQYLYELIVCGVDWRDDSNQTMESEAAKSPVFDEDDLRRKWEEELER